MSQAKADKNFLKAAESNDKQQVLAMLDTGVYDFWNERRSRAQLNATDNAGRNAAMRAALTSQHQMVLWLIARGIDLKATDKNGAGLLHYAASGGHHDLIRDLIDTAKLPVNQSDSSGQTPLHRAVIQQSSHAVINLLIDRDADINKADNTGKTALHYAVKKGNLALVRVLLERGANPNIQDNNGNTPLGCCFYDYEYSESRRYPQGELYRLLLAHNADPSIANNLANRPENEKSLKKYLEEQAKQGNQAAPAPQAVVAADLTSATPVSEPTVTGAPALSMKDRLRTAFENEGLDPDQDEHWRPIGQSAIEHIIGSTDNPRILVTTFNFVARNCTSVSKNIMTGEVAQPSFAALDQFTNIEYVEEAHAKLVSAGKSPPPLWPNGLPAAHTKKSLEQKV